LAFKEYFLLVPEPVERTNLASETTVSKVEIWAVESFVDSASLATVEAGFLAKVSRTNLAFEFARAENMSVITKFYLTQ
jgi:hypothetical protein